MNNIVVFASGTGTNFQAIIDAIERGEIVDTRICGLIAGKPGIQAIERAHRNSIPVHIIEKSQHPDSEDFSNRLLETLEYLEPDLIVLAGYLQKIPPKIIEVYEGRIINIHPSLLPKYGGEGFYGHHVHKAVLDNDEAMTGCTVHYVTEEYDQGAILQQRQVPVHPDDTPESLSKRVSREEHKVLPQVIENLLHNKN